MSTSETEPSAKRVAAAPQLSLLLELQEDDLALDRLAYRRRELPERAAVSELTASLTELSARIAEAEEQREKLSSQLQSLDQRSEAVGARVQTIEQRLRTGRAGSYRDEQAMGDEATSLTRQRRELEDQELEIMEALEPIDAELSALRDSMASATAELALASEQLGIAEAAIDDGGGDGSRRARRDRCPGRARAGFGVRAPAGKARRNRCRPCRRWHLQRLPPAGSGGGAAPLAPLGSGLGRLLRPVRPHPRAVTSVRTGP